MGRAWGVSAGVFHGTKHEGVGRIPAPPRALPQWRW